MFKQAKNNYLLASLISLFGSVFFFFTSKNYVGKVTGILFFLSFLLNVRSSFKKMHKLP